MAFPCYEIEQCIDEKREVFPILSTVHERGKRRGREDFAEMMTFSVRSHDHMEEEGGGGEDRENRRRRFSEKLEENKVRRWNIECGSA